MRGRAMTPRTILLPRGFRASAVHSGIRKNKQRLRIADSK